MPGRAPRVLMRLLLGNILAVGWGAAPAAAQCKDLAQLVRLVATNEWKFERTQAADAHWRRWFFSDEFESSMQQSSTSFGITIPLEGVPLKFDAAHSDANAWQRRKTVGEQGGWDWSSITIESSSGRYVAKEAAANLAKLADICAPRESRFRNADESSDAEAVGVVMFLYDRYVKRGPKLLSVGCSPTLTCSNGVLKHERLKKEMRDREVFRAAWKDANATNGYFIISTEPSGGLTIPVLRPIKAVRFVYDAVTSEPSKLDDYSDFMELRDVGDGPCIFSGGSGELTYECSSDGKYQALRRTRKYTAGEGRTYASVTLTCVRAGCSTHSGQNLSVAPDSKTATASVVTWGPGGTWQFHADVMGTKDIVGDEQAPLEVPIVNGEAHVLVPRTGVANPRILVATRSGDHVIKLPQPQPNDDLMQCTVPNEDPAKPIIEYVCSGSAPQPDLLFRRTRR